MDPPFAIFSLTGKFNEGHSHMSDGGCDFISFANSYADGVVLLITKYDQYRDETNKDMDREEEEQYSCIHSESQIRETKGFYYLKCEQCEAPYVLVKLEAAVHRS